MTTSTATLVHTSSRVEDNRLRVARVAAAGRVAAERKAKAERQAAEREHATTVATAWVEDVRAAGAVRVGFKICDDYGKHRFVEPIASATGTLVSYWGEDVEAWGIRADGEYVANVW